MKNTQHAELIFFSFFQKMKLKARENVAPKIAEYQKIIEGYGYHWYVND